MIIEQKEINKFINEGLRSIKKGIELARKNIVVEVIKQAPKVRKKRTQVQAPPATPETPKVKRVRRKKNLPDLDKGNEFYGKLGKKVTESQLTEE